MECYRISKSLIKALKENKNIKEFVNSLEKREKSDLLNAERLLGGFPSSVNSLTERDLEDIKEQLRAFIKDEKIKHPLKSNPFSYLPDDFKLSIWVGNNHTDKIKYWFKEKFLMSTLFGKSTDSNYISESRFNSEVKKLKNSIFSIISKYLDKEDIDITKRSNYEEYTNRISDFLGSFEKTVQNLPHIEDYPDNVEQIYAFTAIVNFDKLLENIFGDIFIVKDKNYFSSLDAEYSYSKEKVTTDYFTRDDDDAQNALGIASKFTKHIVDIIPYTPIKQTSNIKLTHLNISNLKTLGAVIFDSLQENMKFFKDNLTISFSGADKFSVDMNKILEFRKKYKLEPVEKNITFNDLDFENNASNSIWVVLEYINSVSTDENRLSDYYKLRDFISVPNINVVNSIMSFLNSNNIQEKDKRSKQLKLMDLFITEMENSALATYVSIEDGKIVRKNLGKYNNAAIYLQDNANNALKRKKDSYTKSDDKLFNIPKNIKDLLGTEIIKISNLEDKMKLYKFFSRNLRSWLGISMNIDAFDVFINDIGKTTNNGGKNTGKTTEAVIDEIEVFIKAVLNSDSEEVETGRELISKHLATPIWKAIENSIVSRNNSLPVTTVRTEQGKKIPTFKIPTHIYADLALLQKGEAGNRFVDNVGSLVGTEQKLEVVSVGNSLDASKLKEKDDYIFEDVYLFFKSILEEKKRFSFSVTTYSDKKSQFVKVASIEPFKDVTADTYIKRVKNLNIQRLQNIVDKFQFIFPNLALKGDLNTNLQTIESHLATIEKYSDFEAYLKDAIKRARDEGEEFELTEEVHYSNVKGRLIIPRYIWWSTLLDPEEYKQDIENRHIEKYLKYISKGENEIKFLTNKEINDLLDLFNISKKEYADMFVKTTTISNNRVITTHKVYYEEGGKRILNPILAKNLWIKNLARHDYMELSAKNEFIDPIKYNPKKLEYSLANYLDVAERKFVAGSKRANLYTASIEKGVAHVRNNYIKMAVTEDFKSHIINLENSGKWSPLDGGTIIDAREYYSTLEAYPGKDYAGVFKRFGTFVSKDKSAQKKDSEKYISNDFIRLSGFGYNVLKTLWGHDIIPEGVKKSYDLGVNYFIGEKKITNIKIKYENNTWVALLNGDDPKEFSTLYDLWEILGGAETTNELGQYTEDSQKLIYKFSSIFDWWDVGGHIWTTNTTIKRGITNLNSRESILKGEAPMYMKVNRFSLGMQLDANKEIGDSEIREVSQVISALSQNHYSNEIATSIYSSMNRSITDTIKSFFGEDLTEKIINIVERQRPNIKSEKTLSKNIIDALENLFEEELNQNLKSTIKEVVKNNFFSEDLGTKVAKAIKSFSEKSLTDQELINTIRNTIKKQMLTSMERTSIEDLGTSIARVVGDRFPISSQTFFKSFVKQMLVTMNDEFNISKYSGMGVILVPTEGFVKVAETTNARGERIVKTYSDLMREVTNAKKVANSDFLTEYKKENNQHTAILTALIEALNNKNGNLDKNYGEKIVSLLLASNLIKIQC